MHGNPRESIDTLYTTFKCYRLGDDFVGCPSCVDPTFSSQLAAIPLRELNYSDLNHYVFKAMTTWGELKHFKHFLPRILELVAENRHGFETDLEVIFGKLGYGRFSEWPEPEKAAIQIFFDAYWRQELATPVDDLIDDRMDTILCAIAGAMPTVQRHLDIWTNSRSTNAAQHLAVFISTNEATVRSSGRLCNDFWDHNGVQHREVIQWLGSDGLPSCVNLIDADWLRDFPDFHRAFSATRAAVIEQTSARSK